MLSTGDSVMTCAASRNSHHIRVSVEMKEDINMWLYFLDRFNGTCYFDKKIWLTNKQLNLYMDSAGKPNCGAGVFYSGHCVFLPWPDLWQIEEIMRDITFLELVLIVLALHLFKNELSKNDYVSH